MILIFDTETTGLVKDWNNPNSNSNPHLVQLGFTVCNEEGRSLFTYGSIVHPYYEGDIEPGATKAHGISKQLAQDKGIKLEVVMNIFFMWLVQCDHIVAHNIKFDKIIVEKAFKVSLSDKQDFCTMLESTNICCIPSSRGFKWPKLEEAYDFFFNEKLVGAHDALTDVMACKRIYFDGLKKSTKYSSPMPAPTQDTKSGNTLEHIRD